MTKTLVLVVVSYTDTGCVISFQIQSMILHLSWLKSPYDSVVVQSHWTWLTWAEYCGSSLIRGSSRDSILCRYRPIMGMDKGDLNSCRERLFP